MPAQDDPQVFIIRKDISGGINNRMHESEIAENEVTGLTNVDLRTPGIADKRAGSSLIEDLGDDQGKAAIGFNPAGGTNELVVMHSTKLEGYTGTGTFTEHKTNFTDTVQAHIIKIGESGEGDVLAIQNGTDNAFRMNQSHTFQDLGSTSGTGSDSPPKSLANLWYRNRWWVLKDNLLYWSAAFSADYSSAFDTVNDNFNIPCGEERALIGLRDEGILCFGEDSIWGINPSNTPAATDKPERILDIGCVANGSVVQVGDDVLYLAADGVRGLFRSQQDKLQLKQTFPLSWRLKDQYDEINWDKIHLAQAIFYDNIYLLALPKTGSNVNNEVWAYFPSTNAWSVFKGWSVGAWGKVRFSGEELLYYIASDDSSVYQVFTGTTDNSAVIEYVEEGRNEDLGNPLRKKNGGEFYLKVLATGNVDLTVAASFDDQGFNTLGTLNATGNLITFPVTFPVVFENANVITGKFHLDQYDSWYQARYKISNNVTSEDSDVQILERGFITFLDEYQSEED